MRRPWKQFALGAGSGFAVAVALNLLPYWRTYDAPGTDGYALMGFPFTFQREGGFVPRYEFHPTLLLANVAIAIAFALVAGWAFVQMMRLARRPGRGFAVLPRSNGGAAAK